MSGERAGTSTSVGNCVGPPPRGLEPLLPEAQTVDQQALTENTESVLALRLALSAQHDPDLTAVVTAWSDLSEAVKAGIVAMVEKTNQTR